MTMMECIQMMSAIAGIAMILIGSFWLKQYLKGYAIK